MKESLFAAKGADRPFHLTDTLMVFCWDMGNFNSSGTPISNNSTSKSTFCIQLRAFGEAKMLSTCFLQQVTNLRRCCIAILGGRVVEHQTDHRMA